jgi:RNA polymerase sigma factor (sigma-70 family)
LDEELNRLIREARNGSKEAFAELVHRFKDHVYRYAYGLLKDRAEAEDASQEAFLKCYSNLSRLENAYSFSSWLTRIVSNVCMDRMKKRKWDNTNLEEMPESLLTSSIRAPRRNEELKIAIEEAMGNLSFDHRQVIMLHDVQGYRYEEISQLLSIPMGTVKSRLNAARLAMRQELGRSEA